MARAGFWVRRERTPLPKWLEGQLPVFMVVDGYTLERDVERVVVELCFAQCVESLRVMYEDRSLTERLSIASGGITSVETRVVVPFPDSVDLSTEAGFAALQRFFTPPSLPPTYRNLKRYEPELRLLPWQDYLRAIYEGSGEWAPNK